MAIIYACFSFASSSFACLTLARAMARAESTAKSMRYIEAITPLASVKEDMSDAPLARFDNPAAQGAKDQADGLAHDLRAQLDAGELDGLEFAAGPDGKAEPVKQVLARMDDEDAALKALRDCL